MVKPKKIAEQDPKKIAVTALKKIAKYNYLGTTDAEVVKRLRAIAEQALEQIK